MKLLVVILMAMIATQFVYYNELDRKFKLEQSLNHLRFQAQMDAFSLHARAINQLTTLELKRVKTTS